MPGENPVPGEQTRAGGNAMQEISNANALSHFTDGQPVCKPRKPAPSLYRHTCKR